MRLNSLALRLFLSATTWTVVILIVTGVVLSSIYRAAVERAFDRRLGVYLRTLVADVATPEENAAKFPASEKLFFKPLNETQRVYSHPFRITQPVTIARQRGGTVTVKGTLRYQACDDAVCYLPATVPLTWTVKIK